jgi:hypothetical protein
LPFEFIGAAGELGCGLSNLALYRRLLNSASGRTRDPRRRRNLRGALPGNPAHRDPSARSVRLTIPISGGYVCLIRRWCGTLMWIAPGYHNRAFQAFSHAVRTRDAPLDTFARIRNRQWDSARRLRRRAANIAQGE